MRAVAEVLFVDSSLVPLINRLEEQAVDEMAFSDERPLAIQGSARRSRTDSPPTTV